MRSLLVTLLVLGLVAPALASYSVVTPAHRYTIDVRNQQFRDIWGAWISIRENGPYSASIHVRADGYRDVNGFININPHQQWVQVQVRMDDPSVMVDVTDRAGYRIMGAYVDQYQTGADANEYQIRIRMPAVGFARFGRNDVRVDFMHPNWVNVFGPINAKQVEIRLPRRSFGSSPMVNIRVRIPSDAELGRAARDARRIDHFRRLHGR